jgi:hypothetical protein
MAKVHVEARPKGKFEGSALGGYVVVDRANIMLATFTAKAEAIEWAKKREHHPLVAPRHLNDKKNPDH